LISYSEKTHIFNLETEKNLYYIEIYKGKHIRHLYWGTKIETLQNDFDNIEQDKPFVVNISPKNTVFLETLPLEIGFTGKGDFRHPTVDIENITGIPFLTLGYKSHKITKGKPVVEQFPQGRYKKGDKVETLLITLQDENSEVEIDLIYSVYYDYNIITRSIKVKNLSQSNLTLNTLLSFNIDMPLNHNDENLQLITLEGNWARERHIQQQEIKNGKSVISSNRGSSSHIFNPFCAVTYPSTTEHTGEIWGFSLIYSGNYQMCVEKTHTDIVRISGGINPETFIWILEPQESFTTPEAVLVYSNSGVNGMSNTFHKFFRERLIPQQFANRERPILINNWESTYFDFDHDKIVNIAKKASEVGIELFVLDDGWFGARDGDKKGLGNWVVNREKLRKGLEGLAEEINSHYMEFGLWVEPEMANPDADILKQHPDWLLGSCSDDPSMGRNQYVLDLANPEVVDWLIETFTEIFRKANITYVKWDMNRYLTETYSKYLPAHKKRETSHRYVLGLYRLMDTLVTQFPHILFEGCSGGGGRFDPGLIYYMPQYWTSDNTDAMARLKIQYGTSLVYPIITMGSHVSACPNHQLERTTPIEARLNAAMSGNLGFELDLNLTDPEELKIVKNGINFYKKHRKLIQLGEFYRLLSPFKGDQTSWMFIDSSKTELLLFWFLDKADIKYTRQLLKLPYVDPNSSYIDKETNKTYSGSELINRGFRLPLMNKDYASGVIYLTKI